MMMVYSLSLGRQSLLDKCVHCPSSLLFSHLHPLDFLRNSLHGDSQLLAFLCDLLDLQVYLLHLLIVRFRPILHFHIVLQLLQLLLQIFRLRGVHSDSTLKRYTILLKPLHLQRKRIWVVPFLYASIVTETFFEYIEFKELCRVPVQDIDAFLIIVDYLFHFIAILSLIVHLFHNMLLLIFRFPKMRQSIAHRHSILILFLLDNSWVTILHINIFVTVLYIHSRLHLQIFPAHLQQIIKFLHQMLLILIITHGANIAGYVTGRSATFSLQSEIVPR